MPCCGRRWVCASGMLTLFQHEVQLNEKALHPERGGRITVPEHIQEYGNDELEEWEKALCPVCKRPLNNVAPSSVDSIGHFAHQRNSGYCPTKASAAAPYCGLPPRNPDPTAAIRIKTAFLENWQEHFSMLNWLVKGLSVDEFIDIIKTANNERIWEYAQLEAFQIPFVFATLADFPQSKSFKGKDGLPVRKNGSVAGLTRLFSVTTTFGFIVKPLCFSGGPGMTYPRGRGSQVQRI